MDSKKRFVDFWLYSFLFPICFSLQVLAFNGDNATSNDKQAACLHALPNSFDEVNRVCCFNHTMQLSARSLLKPFSTTIDDADADADADSDLAPPALEEISDEDEASADNNNNNREEEDDALEALSAEEKEALFDNTAAVRTTLDKVCHFHFFCSTY
jgi:hypothetical protein